MSKLDYIKIVVISPVLLLCLIMFLFSKNKTIILSDLERQNCNTIKGLISLIVFSKEFRNIFYYRIGKLSRIPNFFLKENPTLHIMTKEIGSGFLIVHGDATYVNAGKIGNNCYINQCVTIGVIGDKAPIIGDNVRIGTGAIVLGDINVGDNVKIGAGAVVVKSVPSNSTVVGNPAMIVKRDGEKVNLML
jgi:serine O-acetyltransferase